MAYMLPKRFIMLLWASLCTTVIPNSMYSQKAVNDQLEASIDYEEEHSPDSNESHTSSLLLNSIPEESEPQLPSLPVQDTTEASESSSKPTDTLPVSMQQQSMPELLATEAQEIAEFTVGSKKEVQGKDSKEPVAIEDDECLHKDSSGECVSEDRQVIVHREDMPTDERSTKEFDPTAKRKAVITLVEKGLEFLKNNDVDKAFSAFNHDPSFRDGELYLFVYDNTGRCLAHGQEMDMIWKNLWNETSEYGILTTQSIIKEALTPKNDGWIVYRSRNATRISYARSIRKGGRNYIIVSGYYPHAKTDSVENLVRGAVGLFNDIINAGQDKEIAFSIMTYGAGRFVLGDLYLYALDAKGTLVAQGERVAAIGNNVWDAQDDSGKYLNREIIQGLQKPSSTEGIWIDYVSKGAPKKAYAQKVVDKEGNQFFIASGYYTDVSQDKVIDLVKRGAQYFLANGPDKASEEFTPLKNGTFRYGDLSLFVFQTNGLCIANGSNAELVGRPLYNDPDDDGTMYVQAMIQKARDGGGWVDYKFQNAFFSAYVQLIRLNNKEYVIGSGLYPASKRETMELLARSAASFMRTHDKYESFELFTSTQRFTRGDLDIFVFDSKGICYAYGELHGPLWRNLLNFKDDDGREVIKLFINTVKRGAGKVTYRLNGRKQLAYA